MKMGIKYCGGCNPLYDRVEMGKRFVKILNHSVEWVSYDDPKAEVILVIAGCDTACVDLNQFQGRTLIVVTSEESGNALLDRIRELLLSQKQLVLHERSTSSAWLAQLLAMEPSCNSKNQITIIQK